MLKNYIKTAWRSIWKTKGYSFLNIFGLALGIACASLIFLWVEHETSYDKHFENREDLYVVKSRQTYGADIFVFGATPNKLGPAIAAELPEIERTSRTSWQGEAKLFSLEDKNLFQSGLFVEPSFIDMFSLTMVRGDSKNLLEDQRSIIISEKMAESFFGNEDPVGQLLKLENKELYRVSAVTADQPSTSSIQFDWLLPYAIYEKQSAYSEEWGSNSVPTYVQLKQAQSLASANAKLRHFISGKQNSKDTSSTNFLYPMERWHLYNSFVSGNEAEGAIKQVRLFSVIAWIVLLIACINFMNLATARSEKRSREVGMRKVIGAERSSLILQFIGESVVMAACSAVVAIGLIYVFLQPFNNLVRTDLSIGLAEPLHIAFIIGLILICGLVAGSYPALYLSSFQPLAVLKPIKSKFGGTAFIRRALVVLQFAASITLIICTAIIYQQIQHVKGRELGLQKDFIIRTSLSDNLTQHLAVVQDELQQSGVVEQSATSQIDMLWMTSNTSSIGWEGKDPNLEALFTYNYIDEHLVPTLGLKMASGRNFRDQLLGDSSSVLVNQTFAQMIDPKMDVVGKSLFSGGEAFTIVGVIENFVFNDIYSTRPEPLVMMGQKAETDGYLYMKINSAAPMTEAIDRISAIIRKNNPGYPFDYHFLDQDIENKFRGAQFTQKLSGIFAAFSISISCLGLFGLASFMAERRKKEVSIRKVLGASLLSLSNMLSREFVVLVLSSCVIAFPIAYWIMYGWLQSYAYRIEVEWMVFALTGLIALAIALVTVSSQAIRTALSNPTKTLRED